MKDRKSTLKDVVHDGINDGHMLDIHDDIVVLDEEKRGGKQVVKPSNPKAAKAAHPAELYKKGFAVIVKG